MGFCFISSSVNLIFTVLKNLSLRYKHKSLTSFVEEMNPLATARAYSFVFFLVLSWNVYFGGFGMGHSSARLYSTSKYETKSYSWYVAAARIVFQHIWLCVSTFKCLDRRNMETLNIVPTIYLLNHRQLYPTDFNRGQITWDWIFQYTIPILSICL